MKWLISLCITLLFVPGMVFSQSKLKSKPMILIPQTEKKEPALPVSTDIIMNVPEINEGPEIRILEPELTRGITVVNTESVFSVKGIARDDDGISYVAVGDRRATLDQDTVFSSMLVLEEGVQSILIKAVDKLGNSSELLLPVDQTGEKRYALIIGNNDYRNITPLKNPVNDAEDMAEALSSLGFEVDKQVDATRRDMITAIRDFGDKIKKGGVGLFFYAGHGIQVDGINYLLPTDVKIQDKADVEFETVPLDMVLAKMELAQNKMNIVVLDACRENPFRSFRSANRGGLAVVGRNPRGTIIAYSTSPNSVAADGDGENGLYTEELLKLIKTPGLEIGRVFRNVRTSVREKSSGMQIPWETSSIEGEFYFQR